MILGSVQKVDQQIPNQIYNFDSKLGGGGKMTLQGVMVTVSDLTPPPP